MRPWPILFTFIATFCFGQTPIVVKDLPENQIIDCFPYGDELFVVSETVHYCVAPSFEPRQKFTLDINGENPNCTYVSEPMLGKVWSTWYFQRNGDIVFYIVDLDLKEGTSIVRDSMMIENPYRFVYHLRALEKDNGEVLNFFCKMDGLPTKELTILSCDGEGKINSTVTNNFKESNSVFDRFLFFNDVALVSDTRLLFSFWHSYLAVNASLNLEDTQLLTLEYPPDINNVGIQGFFPTFGGVREGCLNYYDIASVALGDMTRYPILGKIKVSEDTVYVDTVYVTEWKSKEELIWAKGSHSTDSIHYSVLNPYYEGIGAFGNFPSTIFVQKYDEDELLWTKEFSDGTNYLRAAFIEEVNDEFFILGGSVFNYENSRALEGFYIILDADGSVLTSSLSLVEDQLQVFPNPTSDQLVIKNPGQEGNSFEYQIIHNSGQIVQSGYGNYGQNLSITNLTPGTYFLKMLGSEKVVPFMKK